MKRQTTNRRRDATVSGYTLPLVIDPPETLCICVPVPDDQFHRAAFLGQMLELARWYTWERDDAHLGKEAAAVWDQIFWIVRDQMALQPRNCGCGCADNTQQRLTSDGTLEVSTDGGLTWNEATPQQDPRQSGSYNAPVDASTDEGKCSAANAAVAYFKQKQAETYAQMSTGATAAELAVLLIGFLVAVGVIVSGGALAVFLAAIGATLAGLDAATWNALFTDDLWSDLLCLIYCAMDETGLIEQDAAFGIGDTIKTMHPDRAGDFIKGLITSMGQVGMTNAIRSGLDGSLSCDDCDCDTVGCDLDFWDVWDRTSIGYPADFSGTIIEKVDDHIRVQFNTNYVHLTTNSTDLCCYVSSWTVVEGGAVFGTARALCGSTVAVDAAPPSGDPFNQCVTFLELQSLGADRPIVDIFFDTCP